MDSKVTRTLRRKVYLGRFGVPVWIMALAAMLIAVAAGQAVGPVNVKGDAVRMREMAHSTGSKQAATNWRKASARWLMACFSAGSISPNVMPCPLAMKTGS